MTTRRDIDRRLRVLALPAVGALAVEPLYVAVDTAIIGRVGTRELAGLALAATVLSVVGAGSNVIAYAATERIARYRGASDTTRAATIATQSLWLALGLGVVVTPLVATVGRLMTRAVDIDTVTAAHAVRYLWVSSLGLPAVLVTMAAQGVMRGYGEYRRPLRILAVSHGANVVIEVIAVFGLQMSVTGSALSTVIAQWLAATWFLTGVRPFIASRGTRGPQWLELTRLARVSGVLTIRVGAMLVILSGATVVAGRSGSGVIAAHQIVMGMFILLALVLDAVALPAQTMVGEAVGLGDRNIVALTARRVYIHSVAIGAAGTGALLLAAGPVARIFTTDTDVVNAAADGLTVLAIGLTAGALAFAGDGVLIGAGDHVFLAVASVVHTVVIAAVLAVTARMPDVAHIWWLFALWLSMRAVTVIGRTTVLVSRVQRSSAALT